MKKFLIISSAFLFLLAGIFYFASFFIPNVIVINSKTENNSKQGVLEETKVNGLVYLTDFQKVKENLLLAKAAFLEADLSERKVTLYNQEGQEQLKYPILALGDMENWGGSAAGFYKINAKEPKVYSKSLNIYLPNALDYYGKYYFHGEPYYSNGAKYISEVSGGFIRLANKHIKELFGQVEQDLPVLVIDKNNDNYQYGLQGTTSFPTIEAKSYLVADLDSGLVFAQKDLESVLPIASLTKLMTALVTSENVLLNKSIQIKKEMLLPPGSTQKLIAGNSFRQAELLYPLLIESSNDAGEILSNFLGKEKTVQLMNEKAKAILMENTAFVDGHGYNANNVSTVKDLYYLARYIKNNRQPIFKITKGESVPTFGTLRFDVKKLKNYNLFSKDADFIGGKTGLIPESKYNGLFVFSFKAPDKTERKVAIIILGVDLEKDLEKDVKDIKSWLKENYFKAK